MPGAAVPFDADQPAPALLADLDHWRALALEREARYVVASQDVAELRHQVQALRASWSWRLTAPLRAVRLLPVRGRAARFRARQRLQTSRSAVVVAQRLRARSRRWSQRVAAPPALAVPDARPTAAPRPWTAEQVALADRLAAMATVLRNTDGESSAATVSAAPIGPPEALLRFERAVAATELADRAVAWLAWVAGHGTWPTDEDLAPLVEAHYLDGAAGLCGALWDSVSTATGRAGGSLRRLALRTGAVLVDVTHTASHDLHTGVQRVTRETVERWHRVHDVDLIAWPASSAGPSLMSPGEIERFLQWRTRVNGAVEAAPWDPVDATDDVLVPLDATVLLPELIGAVQSDRYGPARRAGVLRHLGAIGYDTIPITLAETVTNRISVDYSAYLRTVRHVDRIAAISEASATEFDGFAGLLHAVGLDGPVARAVPLATEAHGGDPAGTVHTDLRSSPATPLVLVVGSHEPRKNHLGVLIAAERLWRRGVSFRLTFVGGSGWHSELFDAVVEKLQALGRPVHIRKRIDEALLWSAYRQARFTLFPSLAEGYGLPIAESLLSGTPVITSAFGSMAEVASGGGALLVDPTDHTALERAMERLLTDDVELARLRTEASRRTWTTWDDYASAAWKVLTDG